MRSRTLVPTLGAFLESEEAAHSSTPPDWIHVLAGLARAGTRIARVVARTGLTGTLPRTGDRNVHGEAATRIDKYAHNAVVEEVADAEMLSCIISEEAEELMPIPSSHPDGGCILALDPLDGSSNLGVNVPVGTIFSLLPRCRSSGALRPPSGEAIPSDDATDGGSDLAPGAGPTLSEILRPGRDQIAAGYILYGAATVLVYTSGRGVHGFIRDPESGEFLLNRRDIRIPSPSALHYSTNEAYTRRWDPRQHQLVRHFKKPPPEGTKGFSARYIGSLVADIHRTLLVGGLFMYPAFRGKPEGKLRLMYEAAPMALIMEQAGGRATNGTEDILDIRPRDIHQRTPLFAGARELMDVAASHLEGEAANSA
ncbi:MAG: fructose-1,6-bisphosphatase [Gammaproteobacteria bacterium]|nr:fructose-1,6-bisphosphatase [Gammaproteobacteria bacterium]MDE0260385.1 fructose-1,6-bisphosphatase [Gammaproteobacteria bacterium]